MRGSLILVLTALLTSTNAALKSAELLINTHDSAIYSIPTTLPRTHKSPKTNHRDEDEERGGSIPVVENLANSLKAIDDVDTLIMKGASMDDVFKFLTVDNVVANNVLANPNVKVWMNNIQKFNMENPTKKTSVIARLTGYYGDLGLARIIETAKHVPSSTAIAKRLQADQLQYWISRRYTPDDVLLILKLDDVGDQLFKQPQLFTWVKYVDDFNQHYLDKQTSLFTALKAHYDEATLTSMLISAQKSSITKSLASRVQSEQTKLWMHEMKSPTELFKSLKLDEGKPFKNPVFNVWMKYSDEYNMIMVEPADKISLMSTMRGSYNDYDLAKMILDARKSPDTANLGERLYLKLLLEWKGALKVPEFYYKALKLHKTGLEPFKRSMYPVWSDYMHYVSVMDPTIKLNMIAPLTRVYGEEKLTTILVTSANVPGTNKIATELFDEQIVRWLKDKKAPEKVASLLLGKGTSMDEVSKQFYDKYFEAFKNLPPDKKLKVRRKLLVT